MTFELSEGHMTFDVQQASGSELDLLGGLSWRDASGIQFWFNDGFNGYVLDEDTLVMSEPIPWLDVAGQPVYIEGLFVASAGGIDVLVGARGSTFRVFDVSVGAWTERRDFKWRQADQSFVPFTPKDVVGVKGLEGLAYYMMAIDEVGALYFGNLFGEFDQVSPFTMDCASATPLLPTQVLTLEPGHGTFAEEMAVVQDNRVFVFGQDVFGSGGGICFGLWDKGKDENGSPINPISAFEADFNGDGTEAIVWVHQ